MRTFWINKLETEKAGTHFMYLSQFDGFLKSYT